MIILAAGASTRLGRPKQLLPFRGKSLLENAVDAANDSSANPVIVVLGAGAREMEKYLDDRKLHVVENSEWERGMASSIQCGMQTLKRVALLSDAVILMVCDQPYVSAELLDSLIKKQIETQKSIVACRYSDTLGTPALFYKNLFPGLLELTGDKGAKKLIEQHPSDVATIDFTLGEIDIDTDEDAKRL